MTAATRGRFVRDNTKGSGDRAGAARSRSRVRRRLSVLTSLAVVVGLSLQLGMAPAAVAAPAPVGNDFVVTTGDLSFILKQIKISERHTTTLTVSNPCGTLVAQPGDGIPDAEQIPDYLTAYGLRTVDGSCNNLKNAATARFAASDEVFPRLTRPSFRDADTTDGSTAPFVQGNLPAQCTDPVACSTTYKQTHGNVVDSQPRIISNLIVDQTSSNPAAVAAATRPVRAQDHTASAVPCDVDPATGLDVVPNSPAGCTQQHHTLFIPNITTDVGLSPPFNSVFTFFGQFFDHGVDQTVKTGDNVFIPLKADDPLVLLGPDGKPNTGDEVDLQTGGGFMVLTRAQVLAGPDGQLGTDDDGPSNTDTPWVDQSQTYTSHASHQVFLREYAPGTGTAGTNNAAAVATGKLLTGLPAGQTFDNSPNMVGGESTWAAVKKQAHDVLGMQLVDMDVVNVPMVATDPYGKYLPGANGLPQYVCKTNCVYTDPVTGNPIATTSKLLEGNIANPVPVPTNVEYFNTPFLTDIAHNADPSAKFDSNGDHVPDALPSPDKDGQPCGAAQTDPSIADTQHTANADFAQQCAGTYDNELLASHASCGDGRCNENIALTSIHQIFHSEHNRLVDYIDNVLNTQATQAQRDAWHAIGVAGAGGTGSYNYGERLFQAARYVTEMEYQHLVFEEFARKVQPGVRPFHVYSPDINPAIEAEFAHAVYRFGHSMLDDDVARTVVHANGSKTDSTLPLLTAFLNPPELYNGSSPGNAGVPLDAAAGAGSVFMGSADQTGNEIDEFVTDTLRNNLLGLPLDLATINMARAREAGVAPLNEVRRQIFAETNDGQLAPYTSWADYGQHLKHPESLINFVAAYGTHPTILSKAPGPDGQFGTADDVAPTLQSRRDAARAIIDPLITDIQPPDAMDFVFGTDGRANPDCAALTSYTCGDWSNKANGVTVTGVDDVDLWVGGLAEITNLFGGLLGSTFNYVFQTQLEKLQDGDRLYYLARTPGMNLRTQLEGNSFSEMIQRNTEGTNTLKADAFATADCKFQIGNLTTPYDGSPTLSMPGLTPLTGAGSVNDDPTTTDCDENQLLLHKPDGTWQYRQFNKIDPSGINGQSVYNGTANDDRVFGGNDNDTFWGGLGNDVIEGNGGDDIALGGEGNDIITDLAGADVPKGGPGNDAVDAGIGDDIPMGNAGSDFINGGANDNESFAGPGNDYVIAGQGADAVFGDGGDDWIEGGTGQDLLQGDHGAPFFDDPAEPNPGNEIMVGQVGENDYDAEGGDDLMAQNAAVDRNAGAGGFDWAFHQYNTVAANDDMMINNNLGGLPIQIIVNRDRWQETEADSGSSFNDTILGADGVLANPRLITGGGFTGCDAIDQAGVDRISGLADLLGPVANFPGTAAETASLSAAGACPLTGKVWGEGDILLGGPGSDTITGRAGDEVIDGDKELTVAIAVTDGQGNELGRTDLMEHAATSGSFGTGTTGMTLQQAVFAGKVDPGNMVNVREIKSTVTAAPDCGAASPVNCDTSVYAGPQSQYTITTASNGATIVTDTTSAPVAAGVAAVGDGKDTVTNVEQLRFTDGVVALVAPPTPTIGAATAGNGFADIAWTPVSGGATVTSFDIKVLSGGLQVGALRNVPSTDTTARINGLTNGTTYTFQVRANGLTKSSPFSAESNAVTPQAQVPGAPTIGTATAAVGGANITWTAPASNGGATITRYNVDVLNSANTVIATRQVTAPAGSTLVSPLPAGQTVRLRVSATNSVGTGPVSALSNAVTVIGDTVAPVVTARTPAAAAANVSVSTLVSASFSEPVQGVTGTTFTVRIGAGAAIPATLSLNPGGTSATLTPSAPLANATTYTVTLTGGATGIRDLAGNPLATTTWTFRTVADTIAPTVVSRNPAPGATGVARPVTVVVVFSEPVRNVAGNTFTLTNAAGRRVNATVTLSANGLTARLNPVANIAGGAQFRVDLTNGIRDIAGNRLVALNWNFTT
jgi:Ca2+-binding RTX toxin-like protein